MGVFPDPGAAELTASNTVQWASNAPQDWPIVMCVPLLATDHPAVNHVQLAAAIKTSFERTQSSPVKLSALMRQYIDYQGILNIPLEFEYNGTIVPGFFYITADQAAGDHFYSVYQYLSGRGMYPVYYSQAPLPAAASNVKIFRMLHPETDLEPYKGPKINEERAMWWQVSKDEMASNCYCIQQIDRFKRAVDGISTYFLLNMMKGFTGRELTKRVSLPDEFTTVTAKGPEGKLIIMSLSKEKGIGFQFPVQSTPPQYRDAFYTVMADFTEKLRQHVIDKKFSMDPPEQREGLQHWLSLRQVIHQIETTKGETMDKIGLLVD